MKPSRKAAVLFVAFLLAGHLEATGSAVAQQGSGATAQMQPVADAADSAYREILAQSEKLTKARRGEAQKLFGTGFSLWQSGDFSAAELAFRQGLDIDPANGPANYYYGDCLQRRNDIGGAIDYLTRAETLGAGTPEAINARAARDLLSRPVAAAVAISSLSQGELEDIYLGTWQVEGTSSFQLFITRIEGNKLTARDTSGERYNIRDGEIAGDKITLYKRYEGFCLGCGAFKHVFEGKLISATRIEGTYHGGTVADGVWFAVKN